MASIDEYIDENIDFLEHNILFDGGICILIPRLLASDIATELLIDYDYEESISSDIIMNRCMIGLDDILFQVAIDVKEHLKENGMMVGD